MSYVCKALRTMPDTLLSLSLSLLLLLLLYTVENCRNFLLLYTSSIINLFDPFI